MSTVHVPGMTLSERLRVTGAKLWQARVSYAMLAPFLIAFTVFVVVPVLFSFVLSFTQFNMVQRPTWVGFENYLRMFLDDRIFLIALQNTLVYAAITGPVGYLLSFLFAWLINEMRHRLRIVLTLLFYAPAIAGNAFMIWVLLFSPDAHGYINGTLIALGMITKPIQWLIDPDYMMPIVIGVVLWMSLGTSFLVFIAGLKGIDEFLYEAAAIDGIDNRWQELWYITLPAMRGYLLFGAIVAITESMTNTTIISALTGDEPTDWATWTIVQHSNDHALVRFELGYSSAIIFLLFLAMVAAQKVVQRLLAKVG